MKKKQSQCIQVDHIQYSTAYILTLLFALGIYILKVFQLLFSYFFLKTLQIYSVINLLRKLSMKCAIEGARKDICFPNTLQACGPSLWKSGP